MCLRRGKVAVRVRCGEGGGGLKEACLTHPFTYYFSGLVLLPRIDQMLQYVVREEASLSYLLYFFYELARKFSNFVLQVAYWLQFRFGFIIALFLRSIFIPRRNIFLFFEREKLCDTFTSAWHYMFWTLNHVFITHFYCLVQCSSFKHFIVLLVSELEWYSLLYFTTFSFLFEVFSFRNLWCNMFISSLNYLLKVVFQSLI